MATIKSFTSLEQSKKLAEILPLESADMSYQKEFITISLFGEPIYDYKVKPDYCEWSNLCESIPCWSLAALLELLKEKIIFGGNSPEGWFCCYTIKNPTKVLTIYGDSLVDACVAMIEKLHELNLL